MAADKLGVGLPFYGKNIHTGTAFTYADLFTNGTYQGDGYYSIAGQTVWVPDSDSIENRVQLAHDRGLQHIFIWEMGQDLDPSDPNSMLRIAADKLASLAPVPGDFNGDGHVDATDLTQWQGDYGLNSFSDADGDGDSDGHDFLLWQRNFGAGPGGLAAATVVPEPSAAMLISCFCLLNITLNGRTRYSRSL